ncbi:STAS domain-containing protein [Streptomyces sp. NPDC016845]|uniref:STAS domain-containing protein n=1 Tax=Streptomyces sp. NPDC016845 TaxID=3364972 RepID=UPI0037BD7A87
MAASSIPPVVVVAGPIRPGDASALCDRVRAARERAPGREPTVVCDVSGVTSTDLVTVDALARMQLAARRAGGRIRLRDPSPALALLLRMSGLADALGLSGDGSGGQSLGDAEEREPPLAEIQEAVETGDPAL